MNAIKQIPQFISAPVRLEGEGEICLRVNGDVKARFIGDDLARRLMNDVAVMLMEEYYPDHHFVISLTRGEQVLDTVVL